MERSRNNEPHGEGESCNFALHHTIHIHIRQKERERERERERGRERAGFDSLIAIRCGGGCYGDALSSIRALLPIRLCLVIRPFA